MNERELLDVLVGFATTLTADFSIRDVLDRLVHDAVALLPITGAGVLLMGEVRDHHLAATTDDQVGRLQQLQVHLEQGPCLLAHRSGDRVALPHLGASAQLPRFSAAARQAGFGAVFAFPLRHDGASLGALELYRDTPGDLDVTESEAAQTLADVAASYLAIARRRERAAEASRSLELAAVHDPLTGLPNRRLLEDRLAHAADRTRRTGLSFAVLFCDLDDFKGVNDHLGHHVGDLLLAAVAGRLAQEMRPHDTVARVSGDEFVVLCEDLTGAAPAEEIATRVLAALSRPFPLRDRSVAVTLSVGMSIGIALADGDPADPERVLVRADRAMYAAKRAGGHRLVVAPATPREPPDARPVAGATRAPPLP